MVTVYIAFRPQSKVLMTRTRMEDCLFQQQLPITYTAAIHGHAWQGNAIIPGRYFPQDVTKFNAYAIHGSDPSRVYESLYPVPTGKFSDPDLYVYIVKSVIFLDFIRFRGFREI